MKYGLILAFFVLSLVSCQSPSGTYALIETEYGNMKILLYDRTPLHRDNFVKLVKEDFYSDLLFHRIIQGFMLQGGDPNSRNAPQGQSLGSGGPGYLIDAEIGAPHIKGAIAAARTQNPLKQSSGSQFYIVQGQPITDAYLDQIEQQKNIKYSQAQRDLYKELGGTPQLDQDYTVFGEVVEGMDVIDKIASVQTGQADRPVKDVKMNIRMVR